jgi:hypothetical protein
MPPIQNPKAEVKPKSSLAEILDQRLSSRRRSSKADEKRRTLRDQLWPGSANWIWDINDRERVVGFATIPRLLPWVLHLIKMLNNGGKKGEPSSAYLELWCRDFGQGLVTISDEQECAYASGYASTRALRTWRDHMFKLVEIGFIKTLKEGNREYGQVLLLNPLAVCAKLKQDRKAPEEWWTAFMRRATDIGAKIPPPIDFSIQPSAADES